MAWPEKLVVRAPAGAFFPQGVQRIVFGMWLVGYHVGEGYGCGFSFGGYFLKGDVLQGSAPLRIREGCLFVLGKIGEAEGGEFF